MSRKGRNVGPWKVCWFFVAGMAGLALMSVPVPVNAQWWQRTVTEVRGSFVALSPSYGNEVGIGTSHIEWGVPSEGSFASYLTWEGYDHFPNVDQPWFYAGPTVQPGQRFLAGHLTFGNGTISAESSALDLTVDLSVFAFGSEFYYDNHPMLVYETWQLAVSQTPNSASGTSPKALLANADYVYFPDFPWLGSFRVFEEKTTKVPVYAEFGSMKPVAFGEVLDPTFGALVKSVVDDPAPRGTTTIITGGTGSVQARYPVPPLEQQIYQVDAYAYSDQATVGRVWASIAPGVADGLIFEFTATSTSIGRNSIYLDAWALIVVGFDPEWGYQFDSVPLGYYEVSLDVLDHSAATFADGSQVLNLDFGDIQAGSGMHSLSYDIKNLSSEYRVGLDLDGVIEVSDPGDIFSTSPVPFENLRAGEVSSFYNVFLDSSTPGTFSAQYLLSLSDYDELSGADGAQVLTLNVTANVVPEPSTLALLSMGAIGGLYLWRRRRRGV